MYTFFKNFSSFRFVLAWIMVGSLAQANCNFKLFTIASSQGTKISEYVNQIADECGYTVIVKDSQATQIMTQALHKTNLKNLIITEVFDLILRENNLHYQLKDNVLKISYLITKTYNLDYIISERKGTSSTNITLSSKSGSGAQAQQASTSQASQGESLSGLQINSTDSFSLWESIQEEIQLILNRPEDNYEASIPTLNKEAGFITVTATYNQIRRLDTYIEELQRKLKSQVLIDVHLYSVTLSDGMATGIDWSQLFSLQNVKMTQDHLFTNNVSSMAGGVITTFAGGLGQTNASATELKGTLTINDIVKYLKEQGDVRSVSNPKILTLNNQPALISVGNQFFYKITQSTSQNSAGGNTITQNDIVDSVFAGILLDITPEISKKNQVTLKINPSISEIIGTIDTDATTRTLPPDLSRKQLSSVVTANNGEQIILGGLIGTTQSNKVSKVPLLGDIPLIGTLFNSTRLSYQTTELVAVIRPYIIEKSDDATLEKLGFKGILDNDVSKGTFIKLPNGTDAN